MLFSGCMLLMFTATLSFPCSSCFMVTTPNFFLIKSLLFLLLVFITSWLCFRWQLICFSNSVLCVTYLGCTRFLSSSAIKSAFHGGPGLLSLSEFPRIWWYGIFILLSISMSYWFSLLFFLNDEISHVFCVGFTDAVLPFLDKTTFFVYPIGLVIILSPLSKYIIVFHISIKHRTLRTDFILFSFLNARYWSL